MNSRAESLTINRTAVITFVVLLGIATAAPLIRNQFITGPIVNATLLIAVALLGMRDGLLIGLIPSSIALATGLLPPVLAPMIPFIIVGNAILVVTFGYLRNKNYWLGLVSGSILKFAFLSGTSSVVINLLSNKAVAANVAVMMSWPQLVTALAGGLLAYGFIQGIKKPQLN
jgi:uncharacterized membrane protein